jgi:hypothetical protein
MSRKSSGNPENKIGSLWGHRDFGSLSAARFNSDRLKRCTRCKLKFSPELLVEVSKQHYCVYCMKVLNLGGN